MTIVVLLLVLCLSGCNWWPWHGRGKQPQQVQQGLATFYADKYEGRPTASGETFNQNKYTAAHKTYPFGTIVLVKNLNNGRAVKVRINDRGPLKGNRIIDLSRTAARELDMIQAGVVPIRLEVLRWGAAR